MLSRVYQAVAPSVSLNYYARLSSRYRFEEVRESDLSSLAGGSSGGSIIPFGGKSLVIQEPVGVVAAFTAYNFALACFAQKSAPALVAGCTVVVKVPEQNPLSSFVLAELADEVGFPPGVLNFVAAGPAAAEHLVRHPGVDMVSFTGSTTVGSGRSAAPRSSGPSWSWAASPRRSSARTPTSSWPSRRWWAAASARTRARAAWR